MLNNWDDIFTMRFSKMVITMSQSSSLLRNTILALGACHLRCVNPGIVEHRIAEHFQQAVTIKEYQIVLAIDRPALGQERADALFLSGLLLGILAFVLPGELVNTTPSTSDSSSSSSSVVMPAGSETSAEVTKIDDIDIRWLALQSGRRALLGTLSAYLPTTLEFLGTIFLGDERHDWWDRAAMTDSINYIPTHWAVMFDMVDGYKITVDCDGHVMMDEDHTPMETTVPAEASHVRDGSRMPNIPPEGNVYSMPVFILSLLKNLPVNPENVFKMVQFATKLSPQFRDLLEARDERALYLYTYWLGCMCRYRGTWWSEGRVNRDYATISKYLQALELETRPGPEGRMWQMLMSELVVTPCWVAPGVSVQAWETVKMSASPEGIAHEHDGVICYGVSCMGLV
jgi:hypothetical protein